MIYTSPLDGLPSMHEAPSASLVLSKQNLKSMPQQKLCVIKSSNSGVTVTHCFHPGALWLRAGLSIQIQFLGLRNKLTQDRFVGLTSGNTSTVWYLSFSHIQKSHSVAEKTKQHFIKENWYLTTLVSLVIKVKCHLCLLEPVPRDGELPSAPAPSSDTGPLWTPANLMGALRTKSSP